MARKLISPQTKRQIATRKYYQSPEGKKANRINTWKYRGIISKDYNAMYEEYLAQTNCEFCNVELIEGTKGGCRMKCLDHDHQTGLFRNILCSYCNIKREN